jgi:hypothetical protein
MHSFLYFIAFAAALSTQVCAEDTTHHIHSSCTRRDYWESNEGMARDIMEAAIRGLSLTPLPPDIEAAVFDYFKIFPYDFRLAELISTKVSKRVVVRC